MKEFLFLMKNDSTDTELIKESILNWKHRTPSDSFDPLSVWDDIKQARQFFLDHYCMKFENSPLHLSISGKSDELPELKDIQVLMHIQTAKGAFKMGAYDATDCYLKLVKRKSVSNDMRIIVPIIKLKTEQSKSDLRNMDYEKRKKHIETIYGVLKRKMETNRHILGNNSE